MRVIGGVTRPEAGGSDPTAPARHAHPSHRSRVLPRPPRARRGPKACVMQRGHGDGTDKDLAHCGPPAGPADDQAGAVTAGTAGEFGGHRASRSEPTAVRLQQPPSGVARATVTVGRAPRPYALPASKSAAASQLPIWEHPRPARLAPCEPSHSTRAGPSVATAHRYDMAESTRPGSCSFASRGKCSPSPSKLRWTTGPPSHLAARAMATPCRPAAQPCGCRRSGWAP
jgi:hypothetical protein